MSAPERYSSKKVIMGAAMKVFAARGAAGARVDEIVELSGLNVRMIYHHFGSKDGLYEDVIRNLVAGRNAIWPEDSEGSTKEKLYACLEAFAQHVTENEFYARVMLWESAGGWKTAANVVSDSDFFPTAFMTLLDEAKKEGLAKTSLSPRDLWLVFHGQSSASFKDPYASGDDAVRLTKESALAVYKGLLGLEG